MNKLTEHSEDEIRAAAFKLRTEKRMTHRQIADELGIALGRVGEILKGVLASGVDESLLEKKSPPQFIPMLVSKEHVAKLYALAMDEGFDDVNEWIKANMLPWYSIKRDFEWKLRVKLNAQEFATYIQACMIDSIELRELKQKLGAMSNQPVGVAQSVSVPVQQVNKGEVKTP